MFILKFDCAAFFHVSCNMHLTSSRVAHVLALCSNMPISKFFFFQIFSFFFLYFWICYNPSYFDDTLYCIFHFDCPFNRPQSWKKSFHTFCDQLPAVVNNCCPMVIFLTFLLLKHMSNRFKWQNWTQKLDQISKKKSQIYFLYCKISKIINFL